MPQGWPASWRTRSCIRPCRTRRGNRNPARWNMACDYSINPIPLDAGLTLPKDVLIDNRFRGLSAERISG